MCTLFLKCSHVAHTITFKSSVIIRCNLEKINANFKKLISILFVIWFMGNTHFMYHRQFFSAIISLRIICYEK
jgi:hypothetical protein